MWVFFTLAIAATALITMGWLALIGAVVLAGDINPDERSKSRWLIWTVLVAFILQALCWVTSGYQLGVHP